jgi:short-subunit dehydrogenase
MKKLKGKNCLLTGAASGIGRSLAILLAKEGMNLFLVDIDTKNLENVKEEIENIGAIVFIAKCDVSKLEEIQRIADEFYEKLGDVDLLINNAGTAGGGFILDIPFDEWRRVLEVNLWSIIYSINVFLPKMLERGSGHIVNTGSGAGIVGLPYHPHYVASKYAVVGLTEALYSELYSTGVNFSVICPTRVYTNLAGSSPVVINPKLYSITDKDEIEEKFTIFKNIFATKFYEGGIQPDFAAKRYLKGIKKNKLYIFDIKILRVALLIKALALKRGWKAILKKQSKADYKNIEDCLIEAGLSTQEHLKKSRGYLYRP